MPVNVTSRAMTSLLDEQEIRAAHVAGASVVQRAPNLISALTSSTAMMACFGFLPLSSGVIASMAPIHAAPREKQSPRFSRSRGTALRSRPGAESCAQHRSPGGVVSSV